MNNNIFLKGSIIGLLFALLFTPLIVSESLYYIFVTGKVFTFRTIITIVLVLWLILVIKKPQFLPHKTSILASGGIFLTWMCLSNILGVDPYDSFFSNFERMEGWFMYLYLFIFVVIISSVFDKEKIWNYFFGTSLFISIFIALSGVYDVVSRTNVYLGNSSYLAIYLLFNLFFALLLGYRFYKKRIKDTALFYSIMTYYVGAVCLLLYVILKTQTRGTIVAIIVSFILFCILTALSYWKHKIVRVASIGVILLTVIIATLFWQNREAEFIQSNPILSRITTISANEGTGRSRILTWTMGLEGIVQKPIFGWGQENYIYVFVNNYKPEMFGQEAWFDRSHNAFIDRGVESGIVGLLLYLSLFFFVFYTIYTSTSLTRVEKNLLYSVIVAYGVHNIFIFDTYTSHLMIFSVIGFVIHHSNKERLKIKFKLPTQQVIVSILIIFFIVLFNYTVWKPYVTAEGLLKGMQSEDPELIIDTFESISKTKSFGQYEATIRYFAFVPFFAENADLEIQKAYVQSATTAAENLLLKKPNHARTLEMVGRFYLNIGELEKAIVILERLREISPNRQNNLLVLGGAYLRKEDLNKAEEVFKHGWDVWQTDNTMKHYYGAVLLLKGDLEKGMQYVEGYSPYDIFFHNVFTKIKKYDEMVKIGEKIVADDPESIQNKRALISAYVANNQKQKAIELIRSIQTEDPAFKVEGDQMIQKIQRGIAL